MQANHKARLGGVVLVFAALAVAMPAESQSRATHDIQLFTISKSENHNQVQYAVRLDDQCRPLEGGPLVAYWRMLEKGPAVFEALLPREQPAYGVAGHAVVARGDATQMRFALRALPSRAIAVHAWKAADGCGARAELAIGGSGAQLFNVHAYLAWPFGVDRLILSGWSLSDGSIVRETVHP